MYIRLFRYLIIFIVVVAVMSILQRYATYNYKGKDGKNYSEYEVSQLKEKYKKWYNSSALLAFSFSGVLVLLLYKVFCLLVILNKKTTGEYTLTPPNSFWLIPSIIFGLVLGFCVTFILFGYLLKENYIEFKVAFNALSGFDGLKVLKGIGILFVSVGLIITVLGAGWYTKFTNDKIIVNNFLSIKEKAYSYADIKDLYNVSQVKTDNNITESPYFAIVFDNSSQWISRVYGNFTVEEKIKKFISKQSGKDFISVRLIEDIAK